jgi:hypothetical protein
LVDLINLPLKANTKVYAGSLVVIDAGYAAPGRIATGLIAIGRAEKTVDNTGGSAGALTVDVRRGTYKWNNSSAGDAIAQADVGNSCYVIDDQTVAKTSNTSTRSVAGRILAVDATGVFVETIGF